MTELDDQAIDVLQKNDRGGYTVPTARLYPYQWNWDSAFIALGLFTFDRERAWREIEMLLEGQWDNGMIPSIIFRSDDPDYFPGPSVWQTQSAVHPAPSIASTGISQPPVLASVVLKMVQNGGENEKQKALSIFDRILKSHRWFQTDRLSPVSGSIATVHPWETGRDNCPDWELGLNTMQADPALEPYQRMDTKHANPEQRPSKEQYDKYVTLVKYGREQNWDQKAITANAPFVMADPGIHFILLRANRDLLKLAQLTGVSEAVAELEGFIEHGLAASDYFWNDSLQAYTARNIINGEFSSGFSSASALCAYADAGTEFQREQTIEHMLRIAEKVQYLCPSWDPDAVKFDPQRYWCGPVWPQMNYMIAMGFEEQGHSSLAEVMRDDLSRLIQKSGFHECFNPVSGEGCLGADFSWTAAVWLAWASPGKQKLAA